MKTKSVKDTLKYIKAKVYADFEFIDTITHYVFKVHWIFPNLIQKNWLDKSNQTFPEKLIFSPMEKFYGIEIFYLNYTGERINENDWKKFPVTFQTDQIPA